MLISQKWFSLIEILVWILIVSGVMIAAFQTLSAVWVAKVKIVEKTQIEEQAYFSSERFFELIKKWWTLDYEEYWNRYSFNTTYAWWHFANPSWFGNFWSSGNPGTNSYQDRPYNCISNGWGANMWVSWCLTSNNRNYSLSTINIDYTWEPQRYTQYQRQFIDRNSDNDGNNGDEDGDGSIFWDDDDLFLGIWPAAFSWSTNLNKVWELYLISNDERERTYFRWNVTDVSSSPFAPSGSNCIWLTTEAPTGLGCQGTIEMLKLVGVDYGFDHDVSTMDTDGSQNDGVIDTWLIHPDYTSGSINVVAWSTSTNYWQPIFPESVNIKDFEVYVYPNKDIRYSWRDNDSSILIAPYIQISYTIEPNLRTKAKIIGESPSVEISTTIQLSNLDIK